ncbi:Hypothetical predicted protein [Octopus vulgaris]|uniref:Uncharacterized protein n=1 Tax=Octopus vulgaris TaxID=6645 RepID=A0AA36B6S3_OCTVU|nr:Hypothetical predicted protein [Octopus vulgaris]
MLTQAQVYIEKHKITALFEELMNKLVRNAPENPIIYLIKQLYKKAGLDIPFELKSVTEQPRRNSLNLTVFGHSSEIVSKSVALASWSAKPGEPHSSPFLRREKSLTKSWQSPEKHKTSGEVHFNKTTKPVKGQKSEDKKEKTGWNSLTKITTSTFDEFSNQTKGSPSKTTKVESVPKMKDVRKSWAMGTHEEANNRPTTHYISITSPKYLHSKKKPNEDELFSDELPSTPSLKSYRSEKSVDAFSNSTYTPRRESCKSFNALKHKAELERLIMLENRMISPEPSLTGEDEEIDGAIDLLENPSDLESEGVSSVSSVGFKLSKTLRQREDSQVKLNIKLYPSASDLESVTSQSNCFRDHRRHIDQESLASYKFDDSDEEIESASQVSVPINRRYHWNSPDSEEDYIHSPSSKPYVDNQFMSKSLNGLQISQNYMADNSSYPKPNSSVPLPATSPLTLFSKKSKKHEPYQEDSQHSLNREQLQKLKTTSYGWHVAESDTSILSSHTNRF